MDFLGLKLIVIMTETQIIRPDEVKEGFKADRLRKSIEILLEGLSKDHIDVDSIVDKISISLPQELNIPQLIDLVSETLASLTTIHPDHSILAARFLVMFIWKNVPLKFSDAIEKLYSHVNEKNGKHSPLISEKLLKTVRINKDVLDSAIQPKRDFQFTFFGLKTLQKSYLLKLDNSVVETPQFLFMRVSLGIHENDIDSVIETYNLMSERYFIHASPTLFNSGTNLPYLSSCFLLSMKDDSIDGIYKTLHDCALISKASGGIGLHVSNIRSAGSYIAGSNGYSSGIIPMLRVFNNTARYVDQGGNKRPGAFAIYLEPWHSDVFEFLDLRKNHGKEEVRARDLFLALWVPDLFMEKVKANEDWSLFSPDEAKGLNEVYGDEFVKLYSKYVEEGKSMKIIKAQKLWHAILEAQTETGGPFILYKDACNKKSNQKNLGVIKSSNLCCEVVQYSSPEETAVCNLASVALPSFVRYNNDEIWFDYKKLHDVVKIVTRNLNKVIDVGLYPLPESEASNLKHRPIAIGVQGLADLFMELRVPFESEEAKSLNINIFETIYHAALEASNELSTIHGVYESYEGSPSSNGLLQFDLWNHKPTDLYNWDLLKSKISKTGLRNSLLVAPMPTASTSQILGFTESFEPITSNIYTRRVLSGEFQIINKYLVNDLIELGLWNESIKNLIVDNNGSIQNIKSIPEDIKELYKTIWELPQKKLIDLAVDRAPFIDQSQSMNVYLKEPTMGKLTSMHFYGWKKGLKTGMYYLRTQAASAAIKFTIDRSKITIDEEKNLVKVKKRIYSPLGINNKKSRLLEMPSSPIISESLTSEDFDIHSSRPLSCNIDDPTNCDSCSG